MEHVYVQIAMDILGAAFVAFGALCGLKVGLRGLVGRVDRLEHGADNLTKDFVPRSEVELALAYIRDQVREIKEILQNRALVVKAISAASSQNLQYSARGMALTEASESLRLEAYHDSVGRLTIGWGHTGPDVHLGMTITRDQAIGMLLHDVGWAQDCVSRVVKVDITQNQHDALVDFAFNLGAGALAGSELLRKVNAGDFAGAAEQFALWCHAGGKVEDGLVTRRAREAELFRTPDGTVSLSASGGDDLSLEQLIQRTVLEDFEQQGPIWAAFREGLVTL